MRFLLSDRMLTYYTQFLWVLVVLSLPWALGSVGQVWVRNLDLVLLFAIAAFGLNILLGRLGEVHFGYTVFPLIGGYVYALCRSPHLGYHFSLLVTMSLVVSVSLLTALLVFLVLKRLSGDVLALGSLFFFEIVRSIIIDLKYPVNWTNGIQGISHIDAMSIGSWDWTDGLIFSHWIVPSLYLYYYLFLALLLLTIAVCSRFQKTFIGFIWSAIADDKLAARAVGVNIERYRCLGYLVSGVIGGLLGALYAMFQGFISIYDFVLFDNLLLMAIVIMSGFGSTIGILLSTALFIFVPDILHINFSLLQEMISTNIIFFPMSIFDPALLRQLCIGLSILVVMTLYPQGFAPVLKKLCQ